MSAGKLIKSFFNSDASCFANMNKEKSIRNRYHQDALAIEIRFYKKYISAF
jgi:hypothetical protein